MGIRFDDIDEADRERLVRWVFARERLSRQVTRDG
jgi:c-di-GMP-binding flagellar brake protein YcgR